MSSSENSEIEERIHNDIVVDCYDELERSAGWHCYLDDRLAFPFEAECCQELTVSPLKMKERVMVTEMADQDYCESIMQVQIKWQDRTLAVPLVQLEASSDDMDEETVEAIGDWHYWVEQGYHF